MSTITLSLLVCLASHPATCKTIPIQPLHSMDGMSACIIAGLQEVARFDQKFQQWKAQSVICSDGTIEVREPAT